MGAHKAGFVRPTSRGLVQGESAADLRLLYAMGRETKMDAESSLPGMSESMDQYPIEFAAKAELDYLPGVYDSLPNEDWAECYVELGGEG